MDQGESLMDKFYLIHIDSYTDPSLLGPYTRMDHLEEAKIMFREIMREEDALFSLCISDQGKLTIQSFSADFADEARRE
jgi:hypothetical protein